MIDWFQSGGVMMWPVLAAGIAAVVQTARAWRARRLGERPAGAPSATTDSILFWGSFASVAGLIGSVVGVGVMARYLESAPEAQASLVWGGLRVALVPTVLGLAVLAVALCGWASLRFTGSRRERAA